MSLTLPTAEAVPPCASQFQLIAFHCRRVATSTTLAFYTRACRQTSVAAGPRKVPSHTMSVRGLYVYAPHELRASSFHQIRRLAIVLL
jgi:hypothetical protein